MPEMQKEVVLSDREQDFIYHLIETGGNLRKSAELAGYSEPQYAYKLRDRLAEHIVKAAYQYCAMNALKAAKHVVDQIDTEDPPNPIRLTAARDILDRVGVKVKEEVVTQQVVIKPNIFILPEKRMLEEMKVIDHE